MLRFAKKTRDNPRFDKWFPLNREITHDLRRREKYAVEFARHERLKRAPIYAMRRLLNDLDEQGGATSLGADEGVGER